MGRVLHIRAPPLRFVDRERRASGRDLRPGVMALRPPAAPGIPGSTLSSGGALLLGLQGAGWIAREAGHGTGFLGPVLLDGPTRAAGRWIGKVGRWGDGIALRITFCVTGCVTICQVRPCFLNSFYIKYLY